MSGRRDCVATPEPHRLRRVENDRMGWSDDEGTNHQIECLAVGIDLRLRSLVGLVGHGAGNYEGGQSDRLAGCGLRLRPS